MDLFDNVNKKESASNVLHHLDSPRLVVHLQGFFKLFLFVQFIAFNAGWLNSTHMTLPNSEASKDSLSSLATIQIPSSVQVMTFANILEGNSLIWHIFLLGMLCPTFILPKTAIRKASNHERQHQNLQALESSCYPADHSQNLRTCQVHPPTGTLAGEIANV